jgi:hypothetical protein
MTLASTQETSNQGPGTKAYSCSEYISLVHSHICIQRLWNYTISSLVYISRIYVVRTYSLCQVRRGSHSSWGPNCNSRTCWICYWLETCTTPNANLREIQPEKPKAQKKNSMGEKKNHNSKKSGFSDVSNTPCASMGTIYKKISSSTFLS